jgi:hypothetical protein
MALIKGRYKSVEIAEDGTAAKIRTDDGSAIRLSVDDLESMLEALIQAMVAAKLIRSLDALLPRLNSKWFRW